MVEMNNYAFFYRSIHKLVISSALGLVLTACSIHMATGPISLYPQPNHSPTPLFTPVVTHIFENQVSSPTRMPAYSPVPSTTRNLAIPSQTQSPIALLLIDTLTPTKPVPTYVFPVQPVSAAAYVQGHHDYPAVDIQAPIGTEVVAVTNGVIDYVSFNDIWDPQKDDPATRGGLSFAIIGQDGVRYYYSHLSMIVQGTITGEQVYAGQVLGKVGKSGNARYVSPHLHFGISHPTTPDDWKIRRGEIDPYPYLKAWEKGVMLTPQLPRKY
jgi:murein DD-endopeptidase MepM/ murein hydrolase activator NlpD